MKIRIPIPERVLDVYDRFEDWLNVSVYRRVLRIDIILAVLFVFCVAYYWYTTGWAGAVTGGLLFIFIMMCVQWIWKRIPNDADRMRRAA